MWKYASASTIAIAAHLSSTTATASTIEILGQAQHCKYDCKWWLKAATTATAIKTANICLKTADNCNCMHFKQLAPALASAHLMSFFGELKH